MVDEKKGGGVDVEKKDDDDGGVGVWTVEAVVEKMKTMVFGEGERLEKEKD